MCIIAIKEKGVDLPTKDKLENMWENNPHGAGLAFAMDEKVYINKGFLNKKEFLSFLEDLRSQAKNIPMLLHFRIATHGGINQECTHPFPIAENDSLKKLQLITDVAVAHNGIIKIDADEGMSDTMTYIAKVLYNIKQTYGDFYKHPRVLKAIEANINSSKMAFLDKEGKIYKVGEWVKEKDGIFYSNDTYLENRTIKKILNLPQKRFCYTNAYAIENGKVIDYYPLFTDINGNLYEYDEACDCMWEYLGKWVTEDGGPIEEFDITYSFFEDYVDYSEKQKQKKNIS